MIVTILENEQCGICWNLKFDKQGDKTHGDLNKNSHNFVPLDYCVKCSEPKYTQFGFQTHTDEINGLMQMQTMVISHRFISGIEANFQEEKRKKRNVFTFIGMASMGAALIVSISNLIF